ncbi:hypothetical protein [Actinomadura luzonensis]|uniref:hypothetical protein n=1 Tax=Actinomadura luzonensis TaxID=2805427 RepID=UPI0038990751
MLLAASAPGGRAVWRRHAAAAGEALAAAWPGDRAGRYPAALLLWMMRNAGEHDPGDSYAVVAAQRDCPDAWARAVARYVTGFGALGTGAAAAAERDLREAAAGFRALGDRWGTSLTLDVLAGLAAGRGDHAEAIDLTDQALTLTDELGALEDHADLLVNRADLLLTRPAPPAGGSTDRTRADNAPADNARADHALADRARADHARADYVRAADLARRAGSSAVLAAALRGLADLALRDGDPAEAERLYTDALDRNDPHWVRSLGTQVRVLAGLARLAAARGDHAAARARRREAAAVVATMGPSVPDALRLFGLPAEVLAAVSPDRRARSEHPLAEPRPADPAIGR